MIHVDTLAVAALCVSWALSMREVASNGYIGINTLMTWADGEAYCQSSYGTSMATILSSTENTAVRAAATAAGISGDVWGGASDTATDGTWVWSDGSGTMTDFAAYSNWRSNEPNGGTNENCLELDSDGNWNDIPCAGTNYVVCNYPLYVGVATQLTWAAAEAYCNAQHDANLATVTNADAAAAAYAQLSANDVWLGLYDPNGGTSAWAWVSGTAYVYTRWNSGQPDGSTDSCAEMEGGAPGWNNLPCSAAQYFVCDGHGDYTPSPSGAPTSSPTSSKPTDSPTDDPSAEPSRAPTNQPTGVPTSRECDLVDDGLIVSWDSLFSDSSVLGSDSTFVTLTQGVNNVSGTFEVSVSVESEYVVGATYDVYSDYYEGVTRNGYLGVTYVLDTNEFRSEGRDLADGNTCENRVSSSYDSKDYLNDFWNYSVFPSVIGNLGNDLYLEYGDQNIWDLSMVDRNDDQCGKIVWENTFSFYDLWHDCKDSNGSASYDLVISDDSISLNLNFYLMIVSPNPLYLEQCNDGSDDCGQYLVKTLISHPLSIVFSKTQSVISNKDSVFIDLFTSSIIASVFVEDDSTSDANTTSMFILTLITSVPSYMSLNIDSALIVSPTSDDLVASNDNVDFIRNYYISEETSSYMYDECLILTDYRCFQKFEINIELDECPSDTGLQFDGSYYFSADFDCIADDSTVCHDYLSDEPLSITLDSVDLEYQELCDSSLYEIDWNGDISFYRDNTFIDSQDTFDFGDTVYTRVSISDDISNYAIFGMSIVQCYVCTADINDSAITSLSSCLDTSGIVDTGLFYTMPSDTDLSFTNLKSNTSDTIEDFSFVLPSVADDTFYVDCTIELEVNNVVNQRVLLQSSNNGLNGNVFGTSIASAKVTSSNGDSDDDDDDDNTSNSGSNGELSTFHVILIASGCLVFVLLAVIVGLVMKNRRAMTKTTVNTALEIAEHGKGTDDGTNVPTMTHTSAEASEQGRRESGPQYIEP